jgi:redox-sensitive bicupin YhaK (pirin superfamily)
METHLKSVAAVLPPSAAHMVGDGFKVSNFFPQGYKIKMSPFFLLDYNAKMEIEATTEPRGVGVHPHRGFETVTLAYHGAIAHQDSAGNTGIIYPGDVQWMTAAEGILHKELYEEEFSRSGGSFQMVQLWVNLPAKDKMSRPKYQSIPQRKINKHILPLQAGIIEVIAGEYKGTDGAASTFTPIHVYNAKLNDGGEALFSFPAHYNTGFLVIEGNVRVNGNESVPENHFIHFAHDAEEILLQALENSIILVLSGEPLNEPIAQYGPFLMNRPEEIKQALDDYNQGKFGYLE